VALNFGRDVWHDHAHANGGGVVRLVETVHACSRPEALDWLRLKFGWPEANWTPNERRDYAQRRSLAERLAERALLWRAPLLYQCQRAKSAAHAEYLEHPNHQTETAWSNAAQRLYFMENLNGAEFARAYRNAVERHSAIVEQLIAEAQRDQAHAEQCTAVVVAALAMKAVRDER
jgi:hypothetical protein